MRKRGLLLIIFLSVLLMSVVFRLSIERNYSVALDRELGNQCAYIINDAVNYALVENADIAELLMIEKTEQGVISYINTDMQMLNEFAMDVMTMLEDEIRGLENLQVKIPAGSLLFSKVFSGRGPKITLKAYPVGGIGIGFDRKIESGGINQVLFHMDMKVNVIMESIFGFRRYQKDIERTVPVCDIIIVGNVPETYANLPAETDFLNLVP